MKEQAVFFNHENIRLEGLYAVSGGTGGAVISHPHSLMGGEMSHPVVEILTESLFTAGGVSTLRFNFRGVGKSTGVFNKGRGEQGDVLAAVSFLEGQGKKEIVLAGYSFGAWVNAAVLTCKSMLPAIFVSPPIGIFRFDFPSLRGKVGLIICGDSDSYCPVEQIKEVADELPCLLHIMPDTDHFFMSREQELSACINSYLKKCASKREPAHAPCSPT